MGNRDFDVVIIGGGLAGLTLALQLRNKSADFKIAVLERQAGPVPEATFKVGESAVEIGAHYFADVVGIREHLEKQQFRKFGFRYFFNGNRADLSERPELGGRQHLGTGSFQIDRGILENYLREKLSEKRIDLHAPETVKEIHLAEEGMHVIDTSKGQIRCRWVVDASGRNAFLKRRLGLQESYEHKANSAWWRVKGRVDVSDWGSSAEWKNWEKGISSRYYSTNHLMGDGYWVWLIPLSSGYTSIGIVADDSLHPAAKYSDSEKALAWMEKHEPQCAEAIRKSEIADFMVLRNFSYSCKQVYSDRRWALTGEAGLFLDPFYSPGSDFIAISNTYITDLISRDLQNEQIAARSMLYNQIYLGLARQTLFAYHGQYKLFGNPVVMSLKVIWDYALYWSFAAPLFFQKHLTELKFLSHLGVELHAMQDLNQKMQKFFHEWDSAFRPEVKACFLDFFNCQHLVSLNRDLGSGVSTDFSEKLTEKLVNLRDYASEIIGFSARYDGPAVDWIGASGQPRLLGLFFNEIEKAINGKRIAGETAAFH